MLRKLNAAKGGGYIFQSDHSVPSNVSAERYEYVVNLVRKHGKYPLQLGEYDLAEVAANAITTIAQTQMEYAKFAADGKVMQLQHLLPHQLEVAIDEGWPLLVPAGCVEYHGPHLPLGVDTLVVEELCRRTAARTKAVVAPPFWYGPTGYAVTGPDQGTVDVSTERFGRHAKDVLTSFWEIGFKWIVVCIHHQQLDGPEALALRQAAVEVTFEKTLSDRGKSWWGNAPLSITDNVFERIQAWPWYCPG